MCCIYEANTLHHAPQMQKGAGMMTGRLLRSLVMLLAALCAAPALAEKLSFDYRLYQPLKDVLDSGRDDLILYNAKNPAYVTDLIVIRGK